MYRFVWLPSPPRYNFIGSPKISLDYAFVVTLPYHHSTLTTTDFISIIIVLSFEECHRSGITQYLPLCVTGSFHWALSSRFIHVEHVSEFPSFERMNNTHTYTHHIFFVHSSSISGQLTCFHLWAIGTMSTGVQMSSPDPPFNSFGHIPRSGIAVPPGISMF